MEINLVVYGKESRMKREVFEEKYSKASATVLNDEKLECELKTMDPNPIWVGNGTRNLIIVMEELAELQQEISKYLRGKSDHLALVEECADVIMGLDYVKHICNITDEEINKAINVKIDRLRNTDGIYK